MESTILVLAVAAVIVALLVFAVIYFFPQTPIIDKQKYQSRWLDIENKINGEFEFKNSEDVWNEAKEALEAVETKDQLNAVYEAKKAIISKDIELLSLFGAKKRLFQ